MEEPADGLRFVVAALAAWRVAHLLAYEDGPFAVVARLRAAAGRFGSLLDCFQCLSLWVAAPLALWVTTASLLAWACVTLGLSGAACLLQRLGAPPVVMQPLPPGELGSMEEAQGKENPHGMLRTDAGGGSSRHGADGDPAPGNDDDDRDGDGSAAIVIGPPGRDGDQRANAR